MSPSRRHVAVVMLQQRLGLSERRACRITGQHRSSQRHRPLRSRDRDDGLRARLRLLSREHPRWGYRLAWGAVREEGWVVNRKKIQRLWREEGLRVPTRKRKRLRVGVSTVPAVRLRAERPCILGEVHLGILMKPPRPEALPRIAANAATAAVALAAGAVLLHWAFSQPALIEPHALRAPAFVEMLLGAPGSSTGSPLWFRHLNLVLIAAVGLLATESARPCNPGNARMALPLFDSLDLHLGEWGLGSVSETTDGDAPHGATGCPFQAWSVAEVLRTRRQA